MPVLALDRQTREIVGCHIGSRGEEGAIGLWQSLPECYLDAQTYTDLWDAYTAIFYANKLIQCEKGSGETNHIERFNNTLRQRTGPVEAQAEHAVLPKTTLFKTRSQDFWLLGGFDSLDENCASALAQTALQAVVAGDGWGLMLLPYPSGQGMSTIFPWAWRFSSSV